jgi:hypothetical protein
MHSIHTFDPFRIPLATQTQDDLPSCQVPSQQGCDTPNASTIDDSVKTKEALGLACYARVSDIHGQTQQSLLSSHSKFGTGSVISCSFFHEGPNRY